ncbi:hypothetical protein BSKO_04085 [Bryopsis sp. KO-2023]|nr:hypothetical protein BSKO_04085 [Bryopsis sp. KO-2023]
MSLDMYVRVKRLKTTYFLQVKPTDTILEVKQKLQEYCEQPPEFQRLLKQKGTSWTALDDARRLEELEIKNDEIIALCYAEEDGSFEAVAITPHETEAA